MRPQSQTSASSPPWQWPIALKQYDKTPTLTETEWQAVSLFSTISGGDRWSLHPIELSHLQRLLSPINDALNFMNICPRDMRVARRDMVRSMFRQHSAFWSWSEEEWKEVIATIAAHHARHPLLGVGYLLGCLTKLHEIGILFFQGVLASKVFGHELINDAVTSVCNALKRLGYCSMPDNGERRLVCEVLLANRSPFLRDLSLQVLERLRQESATHFVKENMSMLSHALVSLGILTQPLEQIQVSTPIFIARGEIGVSTEWLAWCRRWKETVVAPPTTRGTSYIALLKVGRWLNSVHPEIVSPHQWTRELCAEYVAAISQMKIGDYIGFSEFLATRRLIGKPLKPSTINGHLGILRKFFRNYQDWGWIECRFDPTSALRTPPSILSSCGPNPRVIADDIWAKLLWAGLNLEATDLPLSCGTTYFYPLEMVRAVVIVWLFTGLRNDEIRRLRVGCIRWQNDSARSTENGAIPSKEAVCLLDVPVNKTDTTFTKPVDRLVGEAIMTWERIRGAQPPGFEEKTGDVVNYLFLHRGRGLGYSYLNNSLIPLLCRKAGVPLSDVRGRITSHRARSTIATQLFNAKEPMSLFELQQWLGHRTPSSTQYYARITPTKLAQSYTDAGYFERNIRTIEVLIDRDAILSGATAGGTPWQYFDLGHGYCTNSFFVTCPHRMACARCDFYLPKDSSQAQMLEAKGNLQQMLQKIPLTDDERKAVEEGVEFMEKLCDKLADVPTPAGPTPREIEASIRRKLPVLSAAVEKQI